MNEAIVTSVFAAGSKAKEFVGKILIEPCEEISHLLTDPVKHWRMRNAARMMARTEEIVRQAGYDPEPLRPSTLVPLLAAASEIEDESLMEMMSQLLASHLNPSSTSPHVAYPSLIKEMSPLDAHILMTLGQVVEPELTRVIKGGAKHDQPIHVNAIIGWLKKCGQETDVQAVELACYNLMRLGIFTLAGGAAPPVPDDMAVNFTPLGYQLFISAGGKPGRLAREKRNQEERSKKV